MNRTPLLLRPTLAAVALAAMILSVIAPARGESQPDVIIGWTAWGDAEVVSKLATVILRQGMGVDAELTLADVSVQYRGLAEGDIDVMLMSWQPLTHRDYLRRYEGRIEDLGELYGGANLGLVVPAFIPESELESIADLAGARERLGGRIIGIQEDAGIMAMTREALTVYGLEDYDLEPGTGPSMAMKLGQRIEQGRWAVATGWRPHWKFAAHALRYLGDPKGVFGASESVHAMARAGFSEQHPEIAAFFQRMHFEIDEVEALMAAAREKGHRDAINDWIRANRATVGYWMAGK